MQHRRYVDQFHQFAQIARGFGRDNSAPGVNDGTFGFPDHLGRAPDLSGVAFRGQLVARQMNRRNRRVVALGLEHVLGDIHQHRTRPAGGGNMKRLVNDLRKLHQLLHQKIVFGAGARDAEGVGLLEGVTTDQLGGHLPGDRHDRNRIHQRIDQRGDQVGRTGAGSRAAYAHLARRARISFGGEAGVLLVPHQDVLDRMIVERIVQRQRHAARIPEEGIDLFAQQTVQQHLCTRHQIGRHQNLPPKNGKGHCQGVCFPRQWPSSVFLRNRAVQAGPATPTPIIRTSPRTGMNSVETALPRERAWLGSADDIVVSMNLRVQHKNRKCKRGLR